MSKSILFVFLDYPPKTGPGSNRNYYLKQHFSSFGWKAKVLTISTSKSDRDDSLSDEKDIIRAAGKDSTEAFSIKGKYPSFITIPDRWYLWILPAVIKGYKQSKSIHFDYIYAGFPSYSSTIVGTILSKMLKKPLVLDLRDPFRFRYDPENMPVHWLYRYLENRVIEQAKFILTTTQACSDYYQALYPKFPKRNIHVIHNGFSQEFHANLPEIANKINKKPFVLLHSGILYQIGRNPSNLLEALKILVKKGVIQPNEFILRFRGASAWQALTQQIKDLQLAQYIEFKNRISYADAITEMRNVDANILIQNSLFNLQIPSKLYDILALKKSILAVTDAQGALAKEMSYLNVPYFSNTPTELAEMLTQLIRKEQKTLPENTLQQRNRYTMNQNLSHLLSDALNK